MTRANLRALHRPPPPLPRLSHGSVATVGVIALTLAALVVAGKALVLGKSVRTVTAPAASERLTIALAGSGAGAVATGPSGFTCAADRCVGTLRRGTWITLTPKPARGSRFAGWSGDRCSGTGPCHVRVTGTEAVTARFSPRAHRLKVAIGGLGTVRAGDRRCPPDCRLDLPLNGRLRLAALPAPGWRFAGWMGDCHGSHGCVLDGNRARHVAARFVSVSGPARIAISVTNHPLGANRLLM